MGLSVDLHNGGALGLVGPTVFALGANDKYIVVRQHPATNQFGEFDRSVTNYFIVARLFGSALKKEQGVRGPLTKPQFEQFAKTEALPAFTKVFNDLE